MSSPTFDHCEIRHPPEGEATATLTQFCLPCAGFWGPGITKSITIPAHLTHQFPMQGAAEQGQLLEIKKGDNPHRQKGWVMKPRQWKEASRGHDPSFMAMLFGVAEERVLFGATFLSLQKASLRSTSRMMAACPRHDPPFTRRQRLEA